MPTARAISARIAYMKVAAAKDTRGRISAGDIVDPLLRVSHSMALRPFPNPSRVVFMPRLLNDREVL